MSIHVQKQIRENSTAVSDYFTDLLKWEDEQGKCEKRRERAAATRAGGSAVGCKSSVSATGAEADRPVAPVVAKTDVSAGKGKSQTPAQRIARDKKPMPQYYNDWDTYNADAEVERLDTDEKERQRAEAKEREAARDLILDELAFNADGDRRRTSGARPRVKINVRAKGRRVAPVDLALPKKEEANRYFGAARYREALVAYSAALELLEKYQPPSETHDCVVSGPLEGAAPNASSAGDCAGEETEAVLLKVALLANRAAALLKLEEWREAAVDCTEALRFDPSHHKAILRRGFALAKLKRWSAAARDLGRAVENDSTDRKAAAELNMAHRMLAEQAKDVRAHARALMCDPTRAPVMPTKRLTVRVKRASAECDTSEASTTQSAATPSVSNEACTSEASAPGPGTAGLPQASSSAPEAVEATGMAPPRQPWVPKSVRIRGQQAGSRAFAGGSSHTGGGTLPSGFGTKSAEGSAPASRPMSFYSFEQQWERHRGNPRERAALLRRIGARALPALFRESLDADLVASIVMVLSDGLAVEGFGDGANSQEDGRGAGVVRFTAAVLGAVSRTARFELSLHGLSHEERCKCGEILSALEARSEECGREDLVALRRAYEPPPVPSTSADGSSHEEDPVPAGHPDLQVSTPPVRLEEPAEASAPLPSSAAVSVVSGVAVFSLDGCD